MPKVSERQFGHLWPVDPQAYEHTGSGLPLTGVHYRQVEPKKSKKDARLPDVFVYDSATRRHR